MEDREDKEEYPWLERIIDIIYDYLDILDSMELMNRENKNE